MLMVHALVLQVLWAALFSLAVLVREGTPPHDAALRAAAAAGLLPLLRACMAAYRVREPWARIKARIAQSPRWAPLLAVPSMHAPGVGTGSVCKHTAPGACLF